MDKSISPIAARCDLIQYAHDESLPGWMLNHVHHVDMLLANLCTHQQYVPRGSRFKEYFKLVKLLQSNFGHAQKHQ